MPSASRSKTAKRTIIQRIRATVSRKYREKLEEKERNIAARAAEEKAKHDQEVKEAREMLNAWRTLTIRQQVNAIKVPKGTPGRQQGGKKTRRRNRH